MNESMNAGTILDAIARTLWVCHWVDEHENRRENDDSHELPWSAGSKYEEVAPETPAAAYIDAARLVGQIEARNSLQIDACWARALTRDGTEWDLLDDEDTAKSKEEFGHCIAMTGLGSGVSWMDNHEDYDLEVPEICCGYMPSIDE